MNKLRSEIAFYIALFFTMIFMTTPVMARDFKSEDQIKQEIGLYFNLDNENTSDYVDDATADKLLENKSWLENALMELNLKGYDTSSFHVYNDTASQNLIKLQYGQSLANLENKGLNEQYILQMPEVDNFATNAKDKFTETYGDILAGNSKDSTKVPDSFTIKQDIDEVLINRTQTYGQLMNTSNSIFSDVANNISLGTANYVAAYATKIEGFASMDSLLTNVKSMAGKNNSAKLDSTTISKLATSTKEIFNNYTSSSGTSSAEAKAQFNKQSDSLFVTFTDIANSMVENPVSKEPSFTYDEVEETKKEQGFLLDEEAIDYLKKSVNQTAYIRAEEINNSVLVDSTTKKPISEEKKAEIVESIKLLGKGKENTIQKPSNEVITFEELKFGYQSALSSQLNSLSSGSGPFEYKSTEPNNYIIPSDEEVEAGINEIFKQNNVEIDKIASLISQQNSSQAIQGTSVGKSNVSIIDFRTYMENAVGIYKLHDNTVKGQTTTSVGYKGYNYSIQIGGIGQNISDIALLASNEKTVWYYFPIGSYPAEENIVAKGSAGDIEADDKFIEAAINADEWPNMYSRITEKGYNDVIGEMTGPDSLELDWYAG